MTAHRRIQITIQTDQVVTIRRRGCIRRWCPECGCDVDVVDILQAEALAGHNPSCVTAPRMRGGIPLRVLTVRRSFVWSRCLSRCERGTAKYRDRMDRSRQE
jgi:hypothetical protein